VPLFTRGLKALQIRWTCSWMERAWQRALLLPGLGQLRVHVLNMRVGYGAVLPLRILQPFVPGSSFQLLRGLHLY